MNFLVVMLDLGICIILTFKQVCKWVLKCMVFLCQYYWNFRNEMLGFLNMALMKAHDVDKTHRMERPGIPHNHLLGVS